MEDDYIYVTTAHPGEGKPYPVYVGVNENLAVSHKYRVLNTIFSIDYVEITVWHDGICIGQLDAEPREIKPTLT